MAEAAHRFRLTAQLKLKAVALAALLLLTLLEPARGRFGFPVWLLLLGFATYTAVWSAVSSRLGIERTEAWRGIMDLFVAAGLYFLGPDPAGPLFALVFLVVVCAAPALPFRGSLLYTGLALALVAVVHASFPTWSATPRGLEDLGSRLVLVALGGVGTSAMSRRLLEEQESTRSVRDEAGRLAELDRLRNEFVSTTSHNLRTPLTSIRAGVGMVQSSAADRLTQEEQDLLENARRNSERLTVLIQDLLTLSQLEAGTLHLEPEPLDLRTVVADAISTVHPLIRQKGQTLEVELPEALPVEGDARHLEQVVVNVLANGYRHTRPGTCIVVSGHCCSRTVRLVVRDNGPGIPASELERIFQRFHRAHETEGGTGLGLAIARGIVELHGGRIWAENAQGGGAAFHIELPGYIPDGGTQ
ncbi:MAG: HAMP domain-containing histidine kinase [Chloroflexota bacterium]|nr:HAMP domain-containing histidine kinase [Chloroflexota bacterium]